MVVTTRADAACTTLHQGLDHRYTGLNKITAPQHQERLRCLTAPLLSRPDWCFCLADISVSSRRKLHWLLWDEGQQDEITRTKIDVVLKTKSLASASQKLFKYVQTWSVCFDPTTIVFNNRNSQGDLPTTSAENSTHCTSTNV